jgi:hypothetical protein
VDRPKRRVRRRVAPAGWEFLDQGPFGLPGGLRAPDRTRQAYGQRQHPRQGETTR